MRHFAILMVKVYQWVLSPFIGLNCRFTPSCSHFSIAAFQKYGTLKGLYLTLNRLAKCHPWHEGGHDPVP